MLTSTQISSYNKNGYLVVKDFLSDTQRKLLMERAEALIDDFDPSSSHSIFTTNEQERSSDDYFLSSGDQFDSSLKKRRLIARVTLLFQSKNQLIK